MSVDLKPRPSAGKQWQVYASLIIAALIYGGWAIIAKQAIQHGASPIVLSFYRILGGSFLLCVYLVVPCGSRSSSEDNQEDQGMKGIFLSLARRDIARLLFGSLLLSASIFGFCFSCKHLSVMTVSILQTTIPMIAMVIAAVSGVEEISVLKILGLLITIGGALLVVTHGEHAARGGKPHDVDSLTGMYFLAMNVVCASAYHVCVKHLVRDYPPSFVVALCYTPATGVALVTALAVEGLNWDAWSMNESPHAWLGALYAMVCVTLIGYSFMGWANKEMGPTIVTAFMTLQPFFAAAISWAIADVLITLGQAAGGFIIIVGLAIIMLGQGPTEDSSKVPLLPGSMSNAKKVSHPRSGFVTTTIGC